MVDLTGFVTLNFIFITRKIKVTKLRGLGGKLGESVEEELNCKTLFDLSQLSLKDIRAHFDEKTRYKTLELLLLT